MKPMPWEDETIAANGRRVKENFADWFGDSKMVDAKGVPVIVYHGTRTADRLAGDQGFDQHGAHFGSAVQANDRSIGSENTASIAVYLSIKNPKRVIDGGTGWSRKIEQAKAEGYDGLVYLNRGEGIGDDVDENMVSYARTDAQFQHAAPGASDSWVAFSPSQIKSATGNSGLYLCDSLSIDDQETARRLLLARDAANAARHKSKSLEVQP